jgi:hypothetical protein
MLREYALKCRFLLYSELISPRDQETAAKEKIACYTEFPRWGWEGGMLHHTRPHGKTPC